MLPTHKAVRDLLTDATGRKITLEPAAPFAPGPHDRATYAVYVDDHLRTQTVVVGDLELCVYLGAAVTTVPRGGLGPELTGGRLAPRTADAVRALLAELGGLLVTPSGEPVTLHATYLPGEEPPTDLPAYACTLGQRVDLCVDISSYGPGRLSLVRPVT